MHLMQQLTNDTVTHLSCVQSNFSYNEIVKTQVTTCVVCLTVLLAVTVSELQTIYTIVVLHPTPSTFQTILLMLNRQTVQNKIADSNSYFCF